ncbi:MAG: flagellar hook-basal body protein [Peptococcaceae bacterium]|nr:flagellar hook-basal body protein [Peptococcaceae bacterium]
MLRGLYLADSGLLAAQHLNDVVANNLANVSTPGFKSDVATDKTFDQVLMERLQQEPSPQGNGASAAPIGYEASGVVVDSIVPNLTAGAIVPTGNVTDLAIDGTGLFQVSTPSGIRYTRSGNFLTDKNGDLVTTQGYNVMGTKGPIQGLAGQKFTVSADGTVTANGQVIDKLAVQSFAPGSLRKDGDNLFLAQGQSVNSVNVIKQGYLEQSNVSMATEMTNMINAMRTYEANQKVVQTLDGTLEKAANEIAKIS